MEKEIYEAPKVEVMQLQFEGILCMSVGVEVNPEWNEDVDYGDSDDMWGRGRGW